MERAITQINADYIDLKSQIPRKVPTKVRSGLGSTLDTFDKYNPKQTANSRSNGFASFTLPTGPD